jgi:hypothetical protein
MSEELWRLIAAALGGGLALKLFETLYGEFKEWRSARSASAKSITSNLEPLLKSADELVGKLTSLGRQDFLPLRRCSSSDISDDEMLSVVYLFVQFWAWLELFRVAYYDNELGSSQKGKRLTKFYDCLESRDIRIVDRLYQRALGEAAASVDRSPSFLDFIKIYRDDTDFRRWLRPLIEFLANLDQQKARQRLLRYNTILHAMIDCLDEEHRVTRNRPALPNKLSRQSLRDLEYRWFGRYLKFIKRKQVAKYLGPPEGRP